ncbi:multifunctional CCA addition/repair protein [Agitococcus lubricus]|uniref:Multifunctional CCA protein n=1 Tax=Agitococcus lubricus TaxID=1077255 RepID=A0A2T5IYF9_9GAMM|nr:multifunctional CCA addition/repair protein [Agitococcus lubricus]PTQ89026.1 tRNA nucleotidyltransferase (CCA-adding enzyme) [Agitococcus lubricus]
MKTYLVGGAVRDKLLGRPIHDRDWVIVGATPEQLRQQGFQAVGHDFPVFLHPHTHEEYALARTERKIGRGYHGFDCFFSPDIRLEQDLLRRDLTINAMAQAEDGEIIDPYGGQDDLHAKQLRHVSDAFREDPLRVLRVARFAARFAGDGFRVADDTMSLMTEMVHSGELNHLTAERVWQETHRALNENHPDVYIEVLRECGALKVLFPELHQLFGIPQRPEYHPEIDTGLHLLLCLQVAARANLHPRVRFAVLLHDLGKGITPEAILPRHHGHEERGLALVTAVCQRYKVPKDYQQLAEMVCLYHLECHRVVELRAATLWHKLQKLDAIRRPERFAEFLLACQTDVRGRLGWEELPYPQAAYFQQARDIAAQISTQHLNQQNLTGAALGTALAEARIDALDLFKKHYHATHSR